MINSPLAMIVLIRISLVNLAASVIEGREAWSTSRPLHVRQFLPDRAGIGLHLHLQPGIAGAAAWKQPRSVPGTGMIPNGSACYGPRRRGPRRPGPAARPIARDVLIIRVPRLTCFTAHIVLRYGQEGVAVTCACRLARMRTTWAQED